MLLYRVRVSSVQGLRVPKVQFREPERNLPGRRPGAATAEARFTLQFARAYMAQHTSIHRGSSKHEVASARQVAVNGHGIADLVTVSWSEQPVGRRHDSVSKPGGRGSPTVRAFEVKLTNWRKGMKQAHRYRHFANAAILVLPPDKAVLAAEYLETFRRIRVGLWGFDPECKRIIAYHTPRPISAPASKLYEHALRLVRGKG